MMVYKEFLNSINSFTSKLIDKESIELYDARFEYFIKRDEEGFLKRIGSISEKYRDSFMCGRLENYYRRHPENSDLPFAVFGIENMGKCTINTLVLMNKKIDLVVENYGIGSKVFDYIVCSPDNIKGREVIVFVALPPRLQMSAYYQLISIGVNESNIIMIPDGELFLDFGWQYFDVQEVKPNADEEVFVDAGCFDGTSSVGAYKWAGDKLKKVYAFEPDNEGVINCESRLSTLGCEFEIYNIATWDRKAELKFSVYDNAKYGSKVSEQGNIIVKADSIDNVLDGRKATYIKLDVEGSELKTLYGAQNTIQKWRPKLAISIYHKPEDIIEIPEFMENLGMDYRYIIRQYQSRKCETTLYAF